MPNSAAREALKKWDGGVYRGGGSPSYGGSRYHPQKCFENRCNLPVQFGAVLATSATENVQLIV